MVPRTIYSHPTLLMVHAHRHHSTAYEEGHGRGYATGQDSRVKGSLRARNAAKLSQLPGQILKYPYERIGPTRHGN